MPDTVLVFLKSDERYIFHYDDASRQAALRQLGVLASDRDLSLTWYDAAVIAKQIRDLATEGGEL